jgi:transcriptional regulator with XRE-family HTH domain
VQCASLIAPYEELTLAFAMIKAPQAGGLTQEELAREMETSQSAIARMESGRTLPSGSTLKRFARATGTRLRITFEPARPSKRARA